MYEPEMLFEEVGIVLKTGRCPVCSAPLKFETDEIEWSAVCSGCKRVYGGSI